MRSLWIAASLAGCTSWTPEPCEAPADTATAFDCGAPRELEVGTGRETWEPIPEDGTLDLIRGPQGAQHVFVSLRADLGATPVPLDRASLELVLRGEGGAVLAEQSSGVGLPARSGDVELPGLLWVVDPPEPVVDRPMELFVTLTPVGAEDRWRGRAPVVVRWSERVDTALP